MDVTPCGKDDVLSVGWSMLHLPRKETAEPLDYSLKRWPTIWDGGYSFFEIPHEELIKAIIEGVNVSQIPLSQLLAKHLKRKSAPLKTDPAYRKNSSQFPGSNQQLAKQGLFLS